MTSRTERDAAITEVETLDKATTTGPWQSMRDGNQYVNVTYDPTATPIGASRVDGLPRAWNPFNQLDRPLRKELGISRFRDADADFIARARTLLPQLAQMLTESETERCADCQQNESEHAGLIDKWLTEKERADALHADVERMKQEMAATGREFASRLLDLEAGGEIIKQLRSQLERVKALPKLWLSAAVEAESLRLPSQNAAGWLRLAARELSAALTPDTLKDGE